MNFSAEKLLANNKLNLSVSALLICLFYLLIHPISGFLGGLLLTLTFGTIPTVINILISATLTNAIGCKGKTKYVIFLLISFTLGINTNFPYFLDLLFAPNNACNFSITKPVNILKYNHFYTKVDSDINSNYFIPANGLTSSISIGGDEGCMCLYFAKSKSYSKHILRNISPDRSISQSSKASNYILLTIRGNNKGVSHAISVFENNIKTAWFEMNRVPYKIVTREYGRNKGLLNGSFKENVTDILLHNNIWSFVAGSVVPFSKISDIAQLKEFLNNAASNTDKKS